MKIRLALLVQDVPAVFLMSVFVVEAFSGKAAASSRPANPSGGSRQHYLDRENYG